MAIVCGQAPRCPVADDLGGFLADLRLPSQSGEASASKRGGKLRSDVRQPRVGVLLPLVFRAGDLEFVKIYATRRPT